MDAGWLKTYDAYYTTEVQQIFNTVIGKLDFDSSFTYTVGDMAFFRRYYNLQPKNR